MRLDRRAALAGLAGLAATPALAQTRRGSSEPTTIWATATDRLDYPVADRTIRLAIRATADAGRVRVRLSNAFGTDPLVVASLHIGLRAVGANVQRRSNRRVTFNGSGGIVIPAGASVISDSVALPVAANADLLVSVAISGSPATTTGHLRPKDNSYLSAPGDHGAVEDGSAFPTTVPHWLFADALIGEGAPNAGSVAIIGDSITDSGGNPRGSYQGWVDHLARRLARLPAARRLGLVNAGISGNRIAAQRPGAGINALARLDRDVLSHAGVHTLIVFEGINDIYGTPITAVPLIQAHAQLALRARMAGLRVIGATLLPTRRQRFTAERESVRAALNGFIRSSSLYDYVIDFDRAGRDPADPLALATAYDSGDKLHPSAEGYRAMAAAVPLRILYR
ncbi:GDSL-type esterase/lipase family protein [Sphingomonas sp. LT1P40]|uniref:GDSL-type esterase/lipase family protein n=1 Tax=Alteristakelama amylovorans TaxID=3096166 RepID=UPI002FC7BC23